MGKTGHADLPLHYGRVPRWLSERMARLGGAIVESIVLDYGRSEVIKRISDPLWFQSFGAVLGMDWHSSGITTSVMGALKKSLNPLSDELGIYICGGRGKHSGYARRYHWHSVQMESFLSDPHTAVCGNNQGLILNMVHNQADSTRQGTLEIATEHPTKMIAEIRKIYMPAHHDVKMKDVDLKRLGTVIALAHDGNIRDFENLLLLQGLGPRTLQSLVLVSEVVHGTTSRFSDPARFSFAHGGKDGHPFPAH